MNDRYIVLIYNNGIEGKQKRRRKTTQKQKNKKNCAKKTTNNKNQHKSLICISINRYRLDVFNKIYNNDLWLSLPLKNWKRFFIVFLYIIYINR